MTCHDSCEKYKAERKRRDRAKSEKGKSRALDDLDFRRKRGE